MTSSSAFGISQITLQFDLGRDIDSAAQDVQSAINAAGSTLPRTLPYPPTYAKVNPADAPIVTLALTSPTYSLRQLSDIADTLMTAAAERGDRRRARLRRRAACGPAVRIQADLSRLAQLRHRAGGPAHRHRRAPTSPGRRARSTARSSPTPSPPTTRSARRDAYRGLVVAYRNGAPVLLEDVADVVDGPGEHPVGGWYKGAPAVILDIQRQPGANVVETVELHQRASCRGWSA